MSRSAYATRNFTACDFCRTPIRLDAKSRVCSHCLAALSGLAVDAPEEFNPLNYPPSDVRHYLSADYEDRYGAPEDVDDYDDEDNFERAISECHEIAPGVCLAAGSEHCDWECPFNKTYCFNQVSNS